MAALQRFRPDPRSVQSARRFVADTLLRHPRLHDVVLATSELATNAVEHAHTPFTVRLDARGNWLRLEVSDESSTLPAVNQVSDTKLGLRVTEAVSDQWDVHLTEIGKTVWVEFSARQG
jgi:anti-sigma regulatory factor (Ser/Thr protein kinase)